MTTNLRLPVLSLLLAGLTFACSAPPTGDLGSKADKSTADDADSDSDDADEDDSDDTGSAATKDDDDLTPTTSNTTTSSAKDDTTPATTNTSTSSSGGSSGGLGNIVKMLPMITGLFEKLGGGGFDLGKIFGGLGGSSSGGSSGGFDIGSLGLGLAQDDFGCCDGTKFFHCTSEANECSTKTIKSSNCERVADLDAEMCQ